METPAATNYVTDGTDTIAEYDGSNVLQKRYAFDGTGWPLVQYDAAGNRSWMLPDERRSIVALANDTAAMTAINTYDEYGIPAATNAGTFQYASMLWLSRAGVYAPTFRAYGPPLGRFNQTDPIGMAGGINLYNYTNNDPVNRADPLGLSDDIYVCGNCFLLGGVGALGGSVGAAIGGSNEGNAGKDITVVGNRLPKNAKAAAQPTNPPGGGQCVAPPITDAERAAAARRDRLAFWKSRVARGDPLAKTALAIVQDRGFSGKWANTVLASAIEWYSGGGSTGSIRNEMNSIGVDLMRAHVGVVDQGLALTAQTVRAYHIAVFARHGLPPTAFGANPITGWPVEADIADYVKNWNGC